VKQRGQVSHRKLHVARQMIRLLAEASQLVLLLLVICPIGMNGQQREVNPGNTASTLRVDVNLVTIGVRVSDRKHREVSGLKQEEFSVLEDGKQQKIAVFASEQQPVSILVSLDRSYSMGENGKLDQAKLALKLLFENSHPDNEYALMVFDDQSIPLLEFSAGWQQIEAVLSKVRSYRAGSSVYDSIVAALDRFNRARYPRQVLVVITDGADQHSRLKLEDVLSAVQSSQAQVYLVGFLDPKEDTIFRASGKTVTLVSGQDVDNPRYAFKRLAEESGAERYFPESGEQLATVVRTISEDLRTQYTLGYYLSPSDRGGQYRRIEVRARTKGLQIRSRHGFRSGESEEIEAPVTAVPVKPIGPETIRQRVLPYELKTERRGGQVIFNEDFSDPASGWPQKPGFFLKANKYHLEQRNLKVLNEGRVAANGPWWTDFEASLVVELESTQVRPEPAPAAIRPSLYSQPPAAGLVFRLNERGYYAFVISQPHPGGKIFFKVVKKVSNSTSTSDLSFWEQAWQPRRAEVRYRLGVACHGNQIRLHVDGVQVTELRDESFSDGLLGMVLFGEGHAVFDDLIARSTVEQVLGSKAQ
jgi:Ca-activated chloride channel homolog